MELKPHFRVIRFSPVPECIEAVNVGLLIMDSRPRIVSNYEFEKLACVAPYASAPVLRFWLQSAAEEILKLSPEEVPAFLSSRTSQIKLGRENFLGREVGEDLERKLIHTFLCRPQRPSRASEDHIQYVDTLISGIVGAADFLYGDLLKRAKPAKFLSGESLGRIESKSIRFSRVLVAPRALVIMDGLNLSIASRTQLRQRAAEIGYGFFTFGQEKIAIERIENRKILRTAFLFNKPPEMDRELEYTVSLVNRDADMAVDAGSTREVFDFNQRLRQLSSLV